MLELNGSHFPEPWNVANLLGGAYEAVADTAAAVAQYRNVLRLLPEHAGAQRRLRALLQGT